MLELLPESKFLSIQNFISFVRDRLHHNLYTVNGQKEKTATFQQQLGHPLKCLFFGVNHVLTKSNMASI
ncbi:hypothetical protein AWW67_13155 [Roseivirga seohaensis]|uniref:Uncharacterized protein n=1 Tax=Roseivirga seohaensis TaxID=1914963 RepID=A0A150XKQ1_9BACT|nr:hypothetical protein AWW67_13155 [Roseivirga seohaensis]